MSTVEVYGERYFDVDSAIEYEEFLLDTYEDQLAMEVSDMYTEASIMLSAFNQGELVLEEVEVGANNNSAMRQKNVKGFFNHIAEFLKKIIKFIREALNKFMEGVANSLKTDMEWYKENAAYLDNIPEEIKADIKVTCIPYWGKDNKSYDRLAQPYIPMTPNNVKGVIQKMAADPNIKTKSQIMQNFFPVFFKLNGQNPREAAFLYYTGTDFKANKGAGVIPASTEFKNEDALDAIQKMREFMGRFQDLANKTQTAIDKNAKELETSEKELENEQANECYQVGDYIYDHTLRSTLEGTDLVTALYEHGIPVKDINGNILQPSIEAGMTINRTTVQGQGNSQAGGNAAPPPKGGNNPQPPKGGNPQGQNQTQNPNNPNQDEDAKSPAQRANEVFRICATIGAARMTVVNNILNHYVNTLKQVVDAIKKFKGIQDENKETDKYNKEQRERENQQHADNLRAVKQAREVKRAKMGWWGKIKDTVVGSD